MKDRHSTTRIKNKHPENTTQKYKTEVTKHHGELEFQISSVCVPDPLVIFVLLHIVSYISNEDKLHLTMSNGTYPW